MKMNIKSILGLVVNIMFAASVSLNAQVKVGDNPTTINANSALEIESTNRGLLLPRVSLIALDNPAPLTSHVEGMQVYNTTDDANVDLAPGIYYNDGTKWQRASSDVQRTINEGDGPPSGSCSTAGEMYTDSTESSSTYGEIWICSGGAWVSYTPTVVNASTPFYIGKTTVDAGGNKASWISRRGGITLSPQNYTGNFSGGNASANGIELLRNSNGDVRLSVQRSGSLPNLILTKRSVAAAYKFIEFRVNGSNIGNIARNSAGNMVLNATSDIRLKENIRSTHYSIDDLMKIGVMDYNFISDSLKSTTIGFLAQDLHKVFPDAVTVGGDDANENPWAVDYSKLTPLLVKAVQDQQKQIVTQQKEIADLKYTLNERVAQLEQKSLKKQNRVSKRLAKKKDSGILVYTQKAIQ